MRCNIQRLCLITILFIWIYSHPFYETHDSCHQCTSYYYVSGSTNIKSIDMSYYHPNPYGLYDGYVLSPESFITAPKFPRNSTYINLGVLLSLTSLTTGNILIENIQRLEAFRMIVNQVNQNHSILLNRTIVYDTFDIQRDGSEAVTAAIALYNRNTTVFIGSTSSDLVPILNFVTFYNMCAVSFLSGVRHLVGDSSSEDLDYIPFVRTFTLNDYEIIGLLDFMKQMNWTLITPIFANDTYGVASMKVFMNYAPLYGINTTCMKLVPTLTKYTDINAAEEFMNSISNCIAQSVVNVVWIFCELENAIFVIKALYKNPLNHRLTLVIGSGVLALVDAPQFFAYQSNITLDFLEGTICLTPKIGNQTIFREYLNTRNPVNSNYSLFLQFWQNTFVCVYNSTDESIPVCPDDIYNRSFTSTCRCTGRETLANVELDPLSGYLQDAATSIFYALDNILNCNMDDNSCSEYIDGSMIYTALLDTSFYGATGSVSFSKHDRQNIAYDLVQLNGFGRYTIVGGVTYPNDVFAYSYGNLTFNMSMLHFKTYPDIPISSSKSDDTTYDSAIGITVIILASINVLLCIYSMIVFHINRKNGVIKKSSPFFCQLMLLGLILVDLGLILWSFKPSTTTCIVKAWLTIIGIGLIIANLFAKTYRIFKIFTNIRVKTKAITDAYLLKFSLSVVAIEILLLCIYTFPDGLPSPVIELNQSDPTHGHLECITDDLYYNNTMIGVMIGFNCFIVLLIAIVAFMSRNVASSYNESKYIGIILYFYVVLVLITLPIYYTVANAKNVASIQFGVRSFAFLIGVYFTWLLLFGQKHHRIHSIKKEAKRRLHVESSRQTSAGWSSSNWSTRNIDTSSRSGSSSNSSDSRAAYFGKRRLMSPLETWNLSSTSNNTFRS